jgi:iron complex outermembrane receptor protein
LSVFMSYALLTPAGAAPAPSGAPGASDRPAPGSSSSKKPDKKSDQPTSVKAGLFAQVAASPGETAGSAVAPAAGATPVAQAAPPVPALSPPGAAPVAAPSPVVVPAPVGATPGEPAPLDPDQIPPELLVPATPGAPPSPGSESYDPNAVEVVKVTVDRREQNLQKYAGSASAFSGDDLSRVGVTSVRDMAQVNPALEIGTQEGNTEIFIRGVGSTNNTELGDPSAATHVDGIYIPRPRGVGSMFFDLERVELNRGPQGTIRGRNATAGSLNIITAKPKLGQFAAEAGVQLGNYAQRLTTAMVNIPLGDTLALRAATFSENRDPFFHNGGPISTITPAESADNLAYRVGLKWVPSSFVTVNIGHDLTRERGTGYSGANFNGALVAGLLPSEVPDPRSVVYRGPQPSQSLDHWGVHGDVTLDFGPLLVNYLGSYRDLTYRQITGGNSGVAFPGQVVGNGDLDNWSTSWWYSASQSQVHELRILTPDTARLRATLGGFFFYEKQQVTLYNTADNSNTYVGGEFNMPYVRGKSTAGYLDAVFDIFKWFRATGGLRVTQESKDRTGLGAVWLVDNANPGGQNFRFGTEGFQPAFGARTLYPAPGQAFDANAVFLNGVSRFGIRDTLNGFLGPGGPGVFQAGPVSPQLGHYSGTFLDYRAGVDMDLSPTQLLYGTFTTGHTSGGFNDNIGNVAPTYKPESLYAFELGSKNELLDHKLRVNAAGFLYIYRDQVFQIIQQVGVNPNPTQPPPSSAVRVNVGKSHIVGVDFDTSYRLPLGLVIGVSGLVMDARFDEGQIFDNRVAYGPTGSPTDKVNVKDKHLPRAPTLTVNYSLSQNFRTPIGWFDWIASAQTRSEYFMTVFNGNGIDSQGNVNPSLSDVVPSYTRLDLGVGYTRPDGKARLSAFASNVTNVAYMTTFINQPNLNLRYFNAPRQVGVRLNLYW